MARKDYYFQLHCNRLNFGNAKRSGVSPRSKLFWVAQNTFWVCLIASVPMSSIYAQNTASHQQSTHYGYFATTHFQPDNLRASKTLEFETAPWLKQPAATILAYSNVSFTKVSSVTKSPPKKWLTSDYRRSIDSPFINEESIRQKLQIINDQAHSSRSQTYWINPLQHQFAQDLNRNSTKYRSGNAALSYVLRKSLRRWWKNRNNFALTPAKNDSGTFFANADDFSYRESTHWDYGFRVSNSKVKLTLKRAL